MRLIDADELIQSLAVAFDTFDPRFLRDRGIREGLKLSKKAIEEAKTIYTQQKSDEDNSLTHGKWVKEHNDCCYWFACSRCGVETPSNRYGHYNFTPFCPNCGAKMDAKL